MADMIPKIGYFLLMKIIVGYGLMEKITFSDFIDVKYIGKI